MPRRPRRLAATAVMHSPAWDGPAIAMTVAARVLGPGLAKRTVNSALTASPPTEPSADAPLA
ncbi:hypothetical protein ABZT02_18275 [Streptomyces sp. NPDC005402]|uniref:hypothetical protein n=1 Tax=Streptomyces sp. NPDC005402 TaxID=3155338 RepID=UPI0033B61796